ncbi:MAG TPA: serine hydrolase domain-containing protein [Chitinophagaceae bacterium]|jgi:CubicO group peptidase (beta-lactamase class C family)|nr:serine hydrolase domain-containing protein [Chitinophagaceae bacterium]
MTSCRSFLPVLCLFAGTAAAQPAYRPPQFEDTGRLGRIKATRPLVDSLFRAHAQQNGFPGLAYGVIADGQLLYSGGTGKANVAKGTAATPRTVFRIASMSKSVTALAILRLRDEGKLRLDDPVHLYIPELKKARLLTTDAPDITIRHLLTHSAGFPEDNPWGDRQLADTDADLLKTAGEAQFSNVPGVRYEYSNLGFALLGRIVTQVSGMPYGAYIRQTVFRPLGMHHTYWEYAEVPDSLLALGYRAGAGSVAEEPLLHHGSYGAMGGLLTTIEDFSKYIALHLSAWPPRDGQESGVLKRSSLREMHQPWNFIGLNTRTNHPSGRPCPQSTAYGYGLIWRKDCTGKVWVSHSGGLPGFGSEWRMFPEYGIAVVSFGNLTYAGLGVVNLKVLDTVMAAAGLQPRQLQPGTVLTERKEALVQLLPHWKDAEKSGLFAENFFPDNPVDSLRKQSALLFRNAGRILRSGPVQPENNLRGTFVLEGERKNIAVYFTLTPEKVPLIQEMHLEERDK